jgi:trehalose-6-phosphate synthase
MSESKIEDSAVCQIGSNDFYQLVLSPSVDHPKAGGLSGFVKRVSEAQSTNSKVICTNFSGIEGDNDKLTNSVLPSSGVPVLKIDVSSKNIQSAYQNVHRNGITSYFHGCEINGIPFTDSDWKEFNLLSSRFVELTVKSIETEFTKGKNLRASSQLQRSAPNIIVHDIHLMPSLKMFREQYPDLNTAYFHHIPFTFSTESSQQSFNEKCIKPIIEGILGANVIGFQSSRDEYGFIASMRYFFPNEHSYDENTGILNFRGRNILIIVNPVGIDYENDINLLTSDIFGESLNKTKNKYPQLLKVLTSARAVPAKGLVEYLDCIDNILSENPHLQQNIVFIFQITPGDVNYLNIALAKINYLNNKYEGLGWKPIDFQYGKILREELFGMMAGCEIFILPSLNEGMGLTYHEALIISQHEDANTKAVVISTNSGAAELFEEGILVNPYNPDEIQKIMLRTINRVLSYDVSLFELNTYLSEKAKNINATNWMLKMNCSISIASNLGKLTSDEISDYIFFD